MLTLSNLYDSWFSDDLRWCETFFTDKIGTESLFREFILVVQVLFACFLLIVTATVNMRKYMRSRTRAVMFTDADVDTVSSLETTFCLANLKFL